MIDFLIWYVISHSDLSTSREGEKERLLILTKSISRPALRDRLVFEYQKYTSTGAFSKAFVENFNFYWPYPDRDIFVYDPANDGYEISPMFLRHAYEIRNWTMKPAFFKQFPEMQHDIPLFPGSSDGDVSGGDTWAI